MSAALLALAVAALINDTEVLKDDHDKVANVALREQERKEKAEKSQSEAEAKDSGGAAEEAETEAEEADGEEQKGKEESKEEEVGEKGEGDGEGESGGDASSTGSDVDSGDEADGGGDAGKADGGDGAAESAAEEEAQPEEEKGPKGGEGKESANKSAEPEQRQSADKSAEEGDGDEGSQPSEGRATPETQDQQQGQEKDKPQQQLDGSDEKGQDKGGATPPKPAAVSASASEEAEEKGEEGEEKATDEEDEEAAAEAAHLSAYYSAPRDEHPLVPNLRILTANRIDEVLKSSPPFLLYLFDPTCAACALYTPIIHALAHALDPHDPPTLAHLPSTTPPPSDTIRVYAMNDATDYKPGFLTPDEERRLPLLKLFPQSPSHPPLTYQSSPRLSALLPFLHQHTDGAFDLTRAQARALSRLPQLRRELEVRGRERLERSEDWTLFLGSPCGRWIREYSLSELMNKYVDGEVEGEGEREAEARYGRFVRCMQDREEESIEYFETMQAIASETVDEMKQRRAKRQREGGGGADSTPSAREKGEDEGDNENELD